MIHIHKYLSPCTESHRSSNLSSLSCESYSYSNKSDKFLLWAQGNYLILTFLIYYISNLYLHLCLFIFLIFSSHYFILHGTTLRGQSGGTAIGRWPCTCCPRTDRSLSPRPEVIAEPIARSNALMSPCMALKPKKKNKVHFKWTKELMNFIYFTH